MPAISQDHVDVCRCNIAMNKDWTDKRKIRREARKMVNKRGGTALPKKGYVNVARYYKK